MKLWLDAMLPARLCGPIGDWLGWQVMPVGTRYAEDREIFMAARAETAVVMTKDMDFVLHLDRLGPPPQVIWLTCGNCSNVELERILGAALPKPQSSFNEVSHSLRSQAPYSTPEPGPA